MYNGICVGAGNKIGHADRALLQQKWNAGVRFVYSCVQENDTLTENLNGCNYQGFSFGALWPFRYAPGTGLGDSQAFDFHVAVGALKTEKPMLPPVVELIREEGIALPETNYYRNQLKNFLNQFYTYNKEAHPVIKLTRSLAEWLEPDADLIAYALKYGLWIHEPTTVLAGGKFGYYTLRSYAARPVGGTNAQWVDFPGSEAQFKAWAYNGQAVRFAFPGTTSTPPADTEQPEDGGSVGGGALTDAEKLAKARDLANQLVEVLR